LKKKITQFLIRFVVHLMVMMLVGILVTKIYYPDAPLYNLLLIQEEFLGLSVFAALVTSIVGQKFTDL